MNALGGNRYTDAWSALGTTIRRPRAVLMISAHWYASGTRVTLVPGRAPTTTS